MSMQYYIFSIIIAMGTMMSFGSPISFSPLENPSFVEKLSESLEEMRSLKELLKQGDLISFYQKAHEQYYENCPSPEKQESLQLFLSFSYYIASAPLFPFEGYDSNTQASFHDDKDLVLIFDVNSRLLKIARNELDDFEDKKSLTKKEGS